MLPQNDKPESFRTVQQQFTRHMRDPENTPAPADIEDRRIGIYRDLLFNNVANFMANSFPVLRKITPDEKWHEMMRDYFKRHKARTPLFPRMPQEFIHYLENERDPDLDPPYTLELAHYEYIETAVSIDTRELDWRGINQDGDLLAGVPVLSPLVRLHCYQYPVHKISRDNLPASKPETPTYMAIYRNRDDKVQFVELNPVSARLLELIQGDQNRTGRELLESIAAEMQHPDPGIVIQGGLDIMKDLRARDVLLGVKDTTS